VTIGIWIIPVFITVVAFWYAIACQEHIGHWADAGSAILNIVRLCLAAIVSLIAWLLWAIIA
jgi:ABC-type nickel/cobalt efflux system permease component RcnA